MGAGISPSQMLGAILRGRAGLVAGPSLGGVLMTVARKIIHRGEEAHPLLRLREIIDRGEGAHPLLRLLGT
jgi:hypothetical protein